MATHEPSPQELTSSLPTFSAPLSQKLDQPLAEDENDRTGTSPRDPYVRLTRRPDPGDTLTPTSVTTGEPKAKPDLKLTGELVAAVIGLGFLAAAALVRLRKGKKLRTPSKSHLKGMGDPLGRIAARHLDAAWLNADLVDAVEAGSAFAAYLAEGPVAVHDRPDPNLPTDLNQEYSDAA